MSENNYDQKVLFNYLRKTIRKLTFTYSIEPESLHKGTHYYTDIHNYDYDFFIYNDIYRRYQNILVKLTTAPSVHPEKSSTAKELLLGPKIFDNAIKEKNVQLYNSMSSTLLYNPISSVLSDSIIMSALAIDEDSPAMDYNAAELMFPYAFIGPRDGINILEFTVLMMLYRTVHHQKRLEKLNSNIEGNYEYSLAFFERLIRVSQDPFFIEELSILFINTFKTVLSSELGIRQDFLYKNYLLSEKYRTRKDPKRAFSNKEHRISEEALGAQLSDNYSKLIFSTNAFVLSAAEDLFKNISTLCYYLIQDHLQNYYINHVNQDDKSILDIDLTFDKSEELINKMRYDYPGESILIDEKKFNIAREMASKALEYISHVTSCALNVLQELPELEPAMEALYKIALAAISTEPSE